MTIHYADGRTVQGVILFRGDNIIRAALKGGGDVAEFTSLNGTWICEEMRTSQNRLRVGASVAGRGGVRSRLPMFE